jgi:hypothetical protein
MSESGEGRLAERNQTMDELQVGDHIELAFAEASEEPVKATVVRILTDQQEGLGPEAEEYVTCWLEIAVEHPGVPPQLKTIAFCTSWKYYLNGRLLSVRKC